MEWKDITGALGSAAPLVGTLLGGPAGAAVGTLVSAALGVKNDPDSVSAALLASPDAVLKVKELQITSQVELQKLLINAENQRLQNELQVFQAEVSDRDSARRLAEKQQGDLVRPAITIIMLVGAILIVWFVFSGRATDLLRDATASLTVGTLIGYWFNELKQTLSFWFGTTKEADNNNKKIAKFATAPGTVTMDEKP